MADFEPFVDVASVQLAGERLVTLPDRYDDPPPARVARYERQEIWMIAVETTSPAPVAWSWPVAGAVRTVDLGAADAAALGVTGLVELNPLPFGIANTLAGLRAGAPTFYFGHTLAYPPDDERVRPADANAAVPRLWFGAQFQDGVTQSPWTWVEAIGDALETGGDAVGAGRWRTLLSLFSTRRSVRLLDAVGRPLPNQTVTVRFLDAADTVVGQVSATSDSAGDLGAAANPPAGARIELSIASGFPLLSWYEGPPALTSRAVPHRSGAGHEALRLPMGVSRAHIQAVDVARWLAPNTPAPPAGQPFPVHFRTRSRVEPLVDGIPTYRRLVPDLLAAGFRIGEERGGAHFMGWAFNEFPLVDLDPETTLPRLVARIRNDGGGVRILAAEMFQPNDPAFESVEIQAAMVATFLLCMMAPASVITERFEVTDLQGLYAGLVLTGLGIALYFAKFPDAGEIKTFIGDFVNQTDRKLIEKLNGGLADPQLVAYYQRHPAAFADNPVAQSITLPNGMALASLQNRFSVFHQKLQFIRRQPETPDPTPDGFHYVAYLGGIDINKSRLDTPGHHGQAFRAPDSTAPPSPHTYHDVHARVTGPAVADAFRFYDELLRVRAGAGRAVFPPPAESVLPPAGDDIVQISQTSYEPASPDGGFPWAPEGDRTTYETLLHAITSAKDYIYIEEQYFVPNDDYVAALREASRRCARLVILLPRTIDDVIFGDDRRFAILDRLAGLTGGDGGWGSRMIAGVILRRPVLGAASRSASVGRCSLRRDVSATADRLMVGPSGRVPEHDPFFAWIGGELVYAERVALVTDDQGRPADDLQVIRGGLGSESRWCPNPRAHQAGEPVTLAQPRAIFVHAKITMVDDVFVSIGSTNLNRRGFFHDGEMSVSTIPDRLKSAAVNPARALRTALWAEHLGITPSMGETLLGDPIAAFELFRRSRYAGNRFTPLRELYVPRISLELPDMARKVLGDVLALVLQGVLDTTFNVLRTPVWNTLVDATSRLDPNPRSGPALEP